MRFLRLEVSHFRAVDHALVEFGPGLNVLYGPNDLGKTTLATAMRAVLLLPAESTAHQQFLPWHSAELPTVSLSFEAQGQLWRISKTFGSSAATSSLLESSLEASPERGGLVGVTYREEERGRAADRRLRELLRWGIEAPGGKGGSRGLPESFLSHVLLAAQGSVVEILGKTLGDDREASGREQLLEALQALAQDPIFQRVLAAVQVKVDAAFTATGRRKLGQTSPFAPVRQKITELAQELERVSHQKRESDEVSQRILLLNERRLALEAELESSSARVAEEEGRIASSAVRRAARERVAAAVSELAVQRNRELELGRLRAELEAARSVAASAAAGVVEHRAQLSAAEAAQARSELELREVASAESRALDAARGEGLERERRNLEARLDRLRQFAARIEAERAAEAELKAATTLLEQTAKAELELRPALERIEQKLGRLGLLEAAAHLRDATASAERARAARQEAEELESCARALSQRAASLESTPGGLADIGAGVLTELRALEGQLRVARARLEVGLTLSLRLPVGQSAELQLDTDAASVAAGSSEPLVVRARTQARVRIGAQLEVQATAGDPALHRELERLEQSFRERALPLLANAGVDSVDALAERVEAARARRRDAQAARRDAEASEARAAEKRALGADLDVWRERVEQRRRELGDTAAAELVLELGALGAAWASALGQQRREAEQEQRRLQAALVSRTAAQAGAAARVTGCTQALEVARTARERAAAELGSEGTPRASELGAEIAATERSLAGLGQRLEALERGSRARVGAAERSKQEAEQALVRARHALDSAVNTERQAREQELTLSAQLAERAQHVDPARLAAAEQACERAQTELAALPTLPEGSEAELCAAREALGRAKTQLSEVLAELRRAEGALGQVGGDVVEQRERQTREALELARDAEIDLEHDYEAYKLLAETLRSVENEQGAHLGRALEGPVSERFRRLTDGRYGRIGLDSVLGFEGVSIAGQRRAYRDLSEGTQEQLATILRLCIAEQLDTALVLDDHLAQTHRERAAWFRSALRQSAERIQIILLTARPEDYLSADELRGEPARSVSAVDLGSRIRRATYASA